MDWEVAVYAIRNAVRGDLDFIIGLAAGEGWNPGLDDAESFYRADPGGFFIGEYAGAPIGCISAVSYGDFGFIGLYMVLEEHRSKGYGHALGEHAMNRLTGCNIGVDGVVAQQENYKRYGFKLAHRNLRFQGILPTSSPTAPEVIPAHAIDFSALADYDSRHFPGRRTAFLQRWVSAPNAATLVYYAAGRIQGYGTIRRCHVGYKIGPLFADTAGIAELLFVSLANAAGAEPVFLDVPEFNDDALAMCGRYGMAVQFETARMYTGAIPDVQWDNVYGITTFELG